MARDLVSLKMFTLTLTTAILGLLFSSCSFGSKKGAHKRMADYAIAPLFLQRESLYNLHRELSPEQMHQQLKHLFEAARWAPSEYNAQPWRFIYGVHGSKQWHKLFSTVVPGNQKWVTNAGALILVLSYNKLKNDKPSRTHSFDTGLAVAQLLLQATELGLVAHPLGGFDYDKARQEFTVPEDYTIEAMIAIGEKASKEHSNESFAKRDARTVSRKPIRSFAFEGKLA